MTFDQRRHGGTGSAYCTYVFTQDAMMLRGIPGDLPKFWFYRSNWRVLHIDGFEPSLFQRVPVRYHFRVGTTRSNL